MKFTITLVLTCMSIFSYSQEPAAWHGFLRINFIIDSTPAYIVQPQHPLPGNPWLWRSYSPEFHVAIDSLLVTRGFHLAFLNYKDLYGQPDLMQLWDKFYEYLTSTKHFSAKPALEGAVRGSLCEFAWAKRNPDKVSCIYSENPVADIKSWPGGKSKGSGDPKQWQLLKTAYHFSEEQALTYADNPKDNLEGLASFKVPLYFSFGLHDALVPMEENSMVIAAAYVKEGGPVTVHPMTRGLQEEKGHHVTIENPQEIADFIYSNSYPVVPKLKNAGFIHNNSSLGNTLYRIQSERKATVAFLGGSITFNKGWRNKVCNYLQEMFPNTQFNFIAAGIPSLGSLPHAFRLERDVLNQGRIDLLFVESAVNDRANGTTEITQRRALEGIIRHTLNENPFTDIVMMAFADEDKLTDYAQGKVPAEVRVHASLSAMYKLPFLDLAEQVFQRIRAGEFSWKDDFKDLHPSPFGQELYFQTIKQLISTSFVGKTTSGLTPHILPVPGEKANYQNGKYLDIGLANKIKNFGIDSSWSPNDLTSTRPGFVKVPMLISEQPGSSFSVAFKGNAIGMAIISGPDAGIIEYNIDGKAVADLDLFTQWSPSLHLPWYLMLADALTPGNHVLNVSIANRHNAKSKGNACRIVYFLVNR